MFSIETHFSPLYRRLGVGDRLSERSTRPEARYSHSDLFLCGKAAAFKETSKRAVPALPEIGAAQLLIVPCFPRLLRLAERFLILDVSFQEMRFAIS
jgi:hypothetical protein